MSEDKLNEMMEELEKYAFLAGKLLPTEKKETLIKEQINNGIIALIKRIHYVSAMFGLEANETHYGSSVDNQSYEVNIRVMEHESEEAAQAYLKQQGEQYK